MEKVQLIVAYEENGEIVFGVSFVGVMDGEYVYAKRTSIERRRQRKNYVKVKIAETTDQTAKYISNFSFKSKILEMIVDDQAGLNDIRIRSIEQKSNQELIYKIDDVAAEAEKALKKYISK